MAEFDPAVEGFTVIVNRHGLKIFVKLIMVPGCLRNVYLVHGLGNAHDAPVMRALTRAFVDAGYNVIVWDATHSPNRSGGETGQASFYYHHHDLEDVVEWSKQQPWHLETFMLAGHSLGGMAAGTFAAAHPGQVNGLVLVAPVVSGATLRRRLPLPVRVWWRMRGTLSPRYLGMNPYSWKFVSSGWSYNLLQSAHLLSMPVLVVGAGRDVLIPPRLLRRLLGAIQSDRKRLQIVPGARHGFDESWEMTQLINIATNWLAQVPLVNGGIKPLTELSNPDKLI